MKKRQVNSFRRRNERGLTLLECLVGLVILLGIVLAVAYAASLQRKVIQNTDDSVVLNRTATELARRFSDQKLAETQQGSVVIASDGLHLNDENTPGKRFQYIASINIIPSGRVYVLVTVRGEKVLSASATSEYQLEIPPA